MAQQEEDVIKTTDGQNVPPAKQVGISKKVSDHLANERTFLAWIRTGLATIAFGFVVERLKGNTSVIPYHLSSFFGVCLTIDAERFHPSASFPIILTILASLVGVMLAIYLFLTG